MTERIYGGVCRALLLPLSLLGRRLPRATPLSFPFESIEYGLAEEREIKAAARRVAGHTMVSFERLATLWSQVRYLDQCGVAGALVECGTWRGGASGMMALANLRSNSAARALHLFDSFQGLPEPRAETDGEAAVRYARNRARGRNLPIGACVGSLEENRRLLEELLGFPKEKVFYHQGWFEETLPALPAEFGPIALLRLDGDWYKSTRVCLECLFDRVVPGGVIVIDDYGYWEGCRKAVDEFFARRKIRPFLHYIDACGRYFFK